MFCRCFSRVFRSRLRVCNDAEDRAEFILAPQAAVTAEVAVAVAAAAAERFLFKRLRLNRRELELLDEPRPLDATVRFDALDPAEEAE